MKRFAALLTALAMFAGCAAAEEAAPEYDLRANVPPPVRIEIREDEPDRSAAEEFAKLFGGRRTADRVTATDMTLTVETQDLRYSVEIPFGILLISQDFDATPLGRTKLREPESMLDTMISGGMHLLVLNSMTQGMSYFVEYDIGLGKVFRTMKGLTGDDLAAAEQLAAKAGADGFLTVETAGGTQSWIRLDMVSDDVTCSVYATVVDGVGVAYYVLDTANANNAEMAEVLLASIELDRR